MSSNSPSSWSSWVNNKIGQTGPGFASAAAAAPSIAVWLVLEATEVLRGFMPREGGVPVSPWWWTGTAPGTFHSQEEFWCLWSQVMLGTLQGTKGLGGTWGAHGVSSWVPSGLSTTGTCWGWVPLTAWQKVNRVAWEKLYPAWVRSSSASQVWRVKASSKK